MSSEFTTLALLTYSLALIGIFAFPSVRQRVPRVAVALLVIVPWAAALFAGALTNDNTYDVPPVLAIELHDPPRSEDPIIFDENGTEYVRADRYDTLTDDQKYMVNHLPVFDTSYRRMLSTTTTATAGFGKDTPSCFWDLGEGHRAGLRKGKCHLYLTPNLLKYSGYTRESLRWLVRQMQCPDLSKPELTIQDNVHYDIVTCPE